MEQRDKILIEITDVLRNDSRIMAAFLHGSHAKGTNRPDSDIDVALLIEPGLTFSARDTIELSTALPSDVHLGLLNHDNLIFIKEVIVHGQPLFVRDTFRTDEFMATALALYAKLKEDAREIYNAYTV